MHIMKKLSGFGEHMKIIRSKHEMVEIVGYTYIIKAKFLQIENMEKDKLKLA